MATRTINSPGVEIHEYDLSERSTLQAGTNILVQGFAHQGPTNELIQLTTKDELNDVFFGGMGPTNAAERYFFQSCSKVLESPATLFAVRLPYGGETGEGFSGNYVALAFEGTTGPVEFIEPEDNSESNNVNYLANDFYRFSNFVYGTNKIVTVGDKTLDKIIADFNKLIDTLSGDSALAGVIPAKFNSNAEMDDVKEKFYALTEKYTELYLKGDYTEITGFKTVKLTDSDYEAIQLGALESNEPTESEALQYLRGTGSEANAGVRFFIVNKLHTDLDNEFQGFYVAVNDNKPYAAKEDGYDAESRKMMFDGSLYYAQNASGATTPTPVSVETSFRVSDELASDVLSQPSYMFGNASFDSCVSIAVYRMKKDSTSNNPEALTFTAVNYITGSLDAEATMVDDSGYGYKSNFIENVAKNKAPYTEVYVKKSAQNTKYLSMKLGGTTGGETKSGIVCSLGLYTECATSNPNKYIGNLPLKVDAALSLIDNPLNEDLDIVLDSGLSTIWAYCAEGAPCNPDGDAGECEFDDTVYVSNERIAELSGDDYTDSGLYLAWLVIFQKFTLLSETRKDCIFISDPLRCIFVRGADKKVEDMAGYTYTTHIYRPLKNLFSGRNSNYACTYANWSKIYDDYSSSYVWMPPSMFVAPIMAKIDNDYWPWWAPFGLNNGLLGNILDIAFRPNQGQCDSLYKMGVNMFVYFNGDGFVVWGQKTLQYKQSAFDRINVRRLFLYLERATMKAVRYYIGEPNTEFTRTRVVNVLSPIFDTAMANSGVYDYRLVCDSSNNTAEVIDDNQLVVDIYLKPVRTAEFIRVNFYATKTSANFDELIGA